MQTRACSGVSTGSPEAVMIRSEGKGGEEKEEKKKESEGE